MVSVMYAYFLLAIRVARALYCCACALKYIPAVDLKWPYLRNRVKSTHCGVYIYTYILYQYLAIAYMYNVINSVCVCVCWGTFNSPLNAGARTQSFEVAFDDTRNLISFDFEAITVNFTRQSCAQFTRVLIPTVCVFSIVALSHSPV